MRARFFSILIILTLAISCGKKVVPKNDLTQANFNGKVKKVKSQLYELVQVNDTFRISQKVNSRSEDKNELLEYNQNGNLVTSKEFLSNGSVINYSDYKYDQDNKLIKLEETDNYGKGSKITYEYFYNENDSLSKVIFRSDKYERTMKFDRTKKRTIKRTDFIEDTIAAIYVSKLDRNQNPIKQIEYQDTETPYKITERTYENERLVNEKTKQFRKWGTIEDEVIFEYFKNGYPSELENSSTNTIIQKIYKNNIEIEERWIPPKSEHSIATIRKFNLNGDLIEHMRIDQNDTLDIWQNKYKFDSNGNWIKKFSFKNEKPLTVIVREIEYY
ncbi:hypothetical protein LDL76_12550 [Salegentibacter mishustinae]|uniref:hypothetical protein n=1 Tax=Salegentibacter mishustinae TaxID=270918 RepID=UPI001CE0FB4F|nr:hypothetical protein [Salegentibacter mishustinae]UBZ06186.1 hypothetical protein LDL76_12550 [Salegentibacter mishustinae]